MTKRWVFKEVRTIMRYGFPDGDFPVFEEIENDESIGKEYVPFAMVHEIIGSNFLDNVGVRSWEDYYKIQGRTILGMEDIFDDYMECPAIQITIKDINGEEISFNLPTRYINEDVEDYDRKYAIDISQPL